MEDWRNKNNKIQEELNQVKAQAEENHGLGVLQMAMAMDDTAVGAIRIGRK